MKPYLEALRHITTFAIDIWFTIGLWKYINYGTQPKFEDLGVIYCILVVIYCILVVLSILYLRFI